MKEFLHLTQRFKPISGDFIIIISVVQKSGLTIMKLQEKDSKCPAKHHLLKTILELARKAFMNHIS